ncbi:MAG: class C sortase [Acidobacteriota bacterium]|nr:class C sortase [Acidobacteriota bacterium]
MMLALVVCLAGVLMICYPFVSNLLNQIEQDKICDNQRVAIEALGAEDLSAEREAALDYNERLLHGSVKVVDPFDASDNSPGNDEYESVLNIAGDGVMGRLVIPSIGVDLPIYHYTTEEVLSHGVGHLTGTSLPIGGVSSHCVLAGHTGLPSAQIFNRLDEVEVGGWFVIQVLGENHAYRVVSTEIVLPEQVESLAIEPRRDLVTLVTCTPYGVNTHRLLVHAERCEVPAEWTDESASIVRSVETLVPSGQPLWVYSLAGVAVAFTIGSLILVIVRLRRRRHEG